MKVKTINTISRGEARGGGGRNLADQLTLFKPRGEDYALHTTASPPFKKLATPLISLIEFETMKRF